MKKSIPYSWRRIDERYNLKANKCETCGNVYFPPRIVCPKCRRKGKLKTIYLKGTGKIYSFTEVHSPAVGFEDQVPYVFAIIEMDEGTKITGQIVDVRGKDVKIGDKVKVVFRKIQSEDPEGLIHYGFKFKLIK